jgi:hypothetical protein
MAMDDEFRTAATQTLPANRTQEEKIMRKYLLAALSVGIVSVATMACARSPQGNANATAARTPAAAAQLPDQRLPAKTSALPVVVVTKSPTCGCCKGWVEHMRKSGFTVEVHDVLNLDPVKTRVGVPAGKGSCHTAEVGGYFVEGHVPAEDIKRLLAEKPAAKGLVLPGMPLGSPGMELPDGRTQPYTVELVSDDGSTHAFSHHGD